MSRSEHGPWRLLPAAATLLAVAGGGAVAAPAPPPLCAVVAVSPDYRRDRTVFCVHRGSDSNLVVAVSTDAGRSWRDPAMAGLLRPTGLSGIDLTISLSPAFGKDRSLFATTGSGTFVSTDLGGTFRPVDTLTKPTADGNPVAFVGRRLPLPVVGASEPPRLLLAYAGTQLPALIDPSEGTRRPVTGVPGRGAARFLVPSGEAAPAGALAAVNVPDADADGGEHAVVHRCDAALTCAELLFDFPAGNALDEHSRFVALTDGSVLAVLFDENGRSRVWRSTDGGDSFAQWASVAKILAAVPGGGAPPSVSIATTPAIPRRMFLRVEASRPPSGWSVNAPPASQVFRSDDAGATWRRVAYARSSSQSGARGNLPWTSAGSRAIYLTPDGRLLADGIRGSLRTTWCSLDGGARWFAGCPR